jgi:hypothetical protein
MVDLGMPKNRSMENGLNSKDPLTALIRGGFNYEADPLSSCIRTLFLLSPANDLRQRANRSIFSERPEKTKHAD